MITGYALIRDGAYCVAVHAVPAGVCGTRITHEVKTDVDFEQTNCTARLLLLDLLLLSQGVVPPGLAVAAVAG